MRPESVLHLVLCWLGDRKDNLPIKISTISPQRFSRGTNKRRDRGEPSNPSSPVKPLLKWWQRGCSANAIL